MVVGRIGVACVAQSGRTGPTAVVRDSVSSAKAISSPSSDCPTNKGNQHAVSAVTTSNRAQPRVWLSALFAAICLTAW